MRVFGIMEFNNEHSLLHRALQSTRVTLKRLACLNLVRQIDDLADNLTIKTGRPGNVTGRKRPRRCRLHGQRIREQ